MAEHAMQISYGMLNAFVKKALVENSVRSTKDQQLQLQTRPKPQWHRLVSSIQFIFGIEK